MNELTVSRADKSYTTAHSRRLYRVPALGHASTRSVSNVSWARAYRARLRITDTAIIFAALALGYFTRLLIDPTLLAIGPSQLRFALGSAGLAVLWLITLAAFRSHDLKTVGVGIDEYKRVLAASITLFGILAIVLIVGGVTSARWFYLSAAPSGVVGLLLGHWLWRKLL